MPPSNPNAPPRGSAEARVRAQKAAETRRKRKEREYYEELDAGGRSIGSAIGEFLLKLLGVALVARVWLWLLT